MTYPPNVQARIEQKVASGRYASFEELIEIALDALEVCEQENEELRRLLLEGVKSGTSRSLEQGDWQAYRTELQSRFEQRQG